MPDSRGLLDGVTVVAIEQAVSAPLCTRTLADLGARVIKIEEPNEGDFTRSYDEVVNGLGSHFVWLARGKESVALNLKDADGKDILHRLLERADVIVSNLGPGATTRLGLSPDTLKARHPHLITLEISGYGDTGPLAHKRAYDLLIQAESGACAITGWSDAPAKPGPPMADACTGLYGAITILSALHDRGRTGRAATTSVSMFDSMVELMSFALNYARHTGTDQVPVGMGSPAVAPYGAYDTVDGDTVVLGTTNDAEWVRLATMIGQPELGTAEKFRTNADRVNARDILDDTIGRWCRQRTIQQVQEAADRAGIGNARYNTPLDVLHHEQLTQRGRWQPVQTPAGEILATLPPPVIEGWTPDLQPVPALGEHTDALLTELGIPEDEVARLRTAGVIGRTSVDPPPVSTPG
jgi:crotonobetainyl-CoA:carnitine CoA-transferase CaiB-like acyl-CoA transferase